MAENTTTLQVLRRQICQELRMPFFRRFITKSTATASTAAGNINDTALTQEDEFWAGHWLYHVDSQEARLIQTFLRDVNSLFPERDFTAAASGDDYEIQSLFNAPEIHAAINRAIQSVGRVFVESVVDETIILEEDQLEYALSSLSKKPWGIQQIWLENSTNNRQGTVASATSTTLVDTGQFPDVTSNWKVSIYKGTGSGQLRSVISSTDDELTVAAWDTTPDTTSKYLIWDPTEQLYDLNPISEYRTDAPEFPDTLLFQRRYPSRYGQRIRIIYTAVSGSLSAEDDTTIVPPEFIINRAASILHAQLSGDNKFDREFHYSESLRFDDLAVSFMEGNAPRQPNQIITSRNAQPFTSQEVDPLDWS